MEDFFCKLPSLCLYAVTGSDAEDFLHAQFSNDLRALDAAHSQLHAYCNPKGRMWAVLWIHRSDSGFIIQVPCELSAVIERRLNMYVLRAEVHIEPVAQQQCVGVVGKKLEQVIRQHLGDAPKDVNGVWRGSGVTAIKRSCVNGPRYQLIGSPATLAPLLDALGQVATAAAEGSWWRQDILAGIPRILQATSEAFVPQMANLDLLDGISFSKGCYPGQEIVARMRYLGKLKQRMQIAHGDELADMPSPGDKITAADTTVGTVVDAQADGHGGYDLLAVFQLDLPSAVPLTLVGRDGAVLSLKPLPYTLRSAEQKQA